MNADAAVKEYMEQYGDIQDIIHGAIIFGYNKGCEDCADELAALRQKIKDLEGRTYKNDTC